MAVCGVELCLSAVFTCLIVLGTFVEGRSLRLRHGHHSRPGYDDFDGESMPRDLSAHRRLDEERDEDLKYRDSYRRTDKWHDYPAAADRFGSSEYEDIMEEPAPSPARHHRYRHGTKTYESLQRGDDERWYDDDYERYASSKFVARRKRQNNRHGSPPVYRPITNEDRMDIRTSKQRDYNAELLHIDDLPFEMEVKEAQNSTICNYTVESISDRYAGQRGSRVPKDLEHVKCNHAGSSCQAGKHCCIQTYRKIDVSYGDGTKERMKIYVGCVCARIRGLEESLLSTND